jgi:hypothetical protein
MYLLLHQTTERLHYATLLVFTGYKLKTHNIWSLRKYAKILTEELFLLFAVENDKQQNHLFDLLKRGYNDSRYKPEYSITGEELKSILQSVIKMKAIVEKICREKSAISSSIS